MQQRELGLSGIQASVVAFGAWAIGGGPWWGPTDDTASIRAIHAALDAGINLIDTAPIYGFGRSEDVIGKALKGRRDRTILATKCGLWWNDDTGVIHYEQLGHKIRRSLDPRTICIEVESSLKRLATDHIDILQTHWQALEPFKTPIADTMACLMNLKQQGKIRAIGASNVTTAEMDEYRRGGPLAVCQPRYSLLDRRIEADILPYCHKNNIATLVYSPLEQGLLTGKIGMERKFTAEEFRNRIAWFKPVNRQRVLTMLAGWQDLTDKYHCTLGQLVIAWTVAQPGVTCALCGARKAADAIENAGAGTMQLDPDDIERIRRDAAALGAPQA